MPEDARDNGRRLFFDRELSWLEFNARVLAEASWETNPLLERVKFLAIVHSNFDEFFMVRVASLSEQDPVFQTVYEKAFDLMRKSQSCLETLMPDLARQGIIQIRPGEISSSQRDYLEPLFQSEILPLLTPIAIREGHSLPVLQNLGVYLGVRLAARETAEGEHLAVIEMPRNYPRFVSVPSEHTFGFMLIEDLVSIFASELFLGYEILEHGSFRITRAAEMTLDEEKDEDFAKVMSEALRARRINSIVRLQTVASADMTGQLMKRLGVSGYQVFDSGSLLGLRHLMQLATLSGFEDLKREDWEPAPVALLEDPAASWDVLKEQDVLLHCPYQSFDAFIRLLAMAASDPDVIAIKQTLYRTSGRESLIIDALERAALSGKQVTVLIELKARFDEENNIEWARRLEHAGAIVLYGVAGLKTHAKACLIVRREPEGIMRYVHLGTGNYNEKTARLYTDISLLSTREELTADVAAFFNVITGYSQPADFRKIEISPFGLRRKFKRLILREGLRNQKENSRGMIIAKMNSLVDPEIIEALYHVSGQGVKVRLNVRGVCCLRPGIPGLSENIEVVSVVDMFLEHSRIFYFANGGDEEVYLSSADWMPRNLDRRLEILFPVEAPSLLAELKTLLEDYFRDNSHAWRLNPDGTYTRVSTEEKEFRIQEELCRKAQREKKTGQRRSLKELKPQKPKVQYKSVFQRDKNYTDEEASRDHLRIDPPDR